MKAGVVVEILADTIIFSGWKRCRKLSTVVTNIAQKIQGPEQNAGK